MAKAQTYFDTQLGQFVFDAFFNIQHDTSLKITEHPIQTGADVSDHAYMEAKQLTFDIGMSDVMDSVIDGQFSDNNSRSVSAYNVLRKLQEQKLPVNVTTRLGVYNNMLIETISSGDDCKTANGLRATVTMKEIFVVEVTKVKVSARPQKSEETNNGDQKAQKADESLLSGFLK